MYKRVFKLFLYKDLDYKKNVYEKSLQLNQRHLPNNYIERLKYEQEEICAMMDHTLDHESNMFVPEEQGLYCKALKIVITEENLHLHWGIVERHIFPKSCLSWMEHVFGPIYELFNNPELNDFIMEWHGYDREAIMYLFLGHTEAWDYQWMTYYRDVLKNPTHYEAWEFPNLPRKIPKCLGHLSGCENRSHHFCDECTHHFNTDPEYAYSRESDCQGDCNIQVPTTPETRQSIE